MIAALPLIFIFFTLKLIITITTVQSLAPFIAVIFITIFINFKTIVYFGETEVLFKSLQLQIIHFIRIFSNREPLFILIHIPLIFHPNLYSL